MTDQRPSLATLLLERLLRPVLGLAGRLLLMLFFFCLVTPTGLLLRLLGYDPLRLRDSGKSTSFYEASRKPPSDHMDRPY